MTWAPGGGAGGGAQTPGLDSSPLQGAHQLTLTSQAAEPLQQGFATRPEFLLVACGAYQEPPASRGEAGRERDGKGVPEHMTSVTKIHLSFRCSA